MKRKIVIFGAGRGGCLAYDFYKHSTEVVAFSDNDPSKHGQSISNIPILSPKDLEKEPVDAIKIASQYKYEIFEQLRDDGLPVEKLELVDDVIIEGGMKFPWTGFLTTISVPVFACLITYILLDLA